MGAKSRFGRAWGAVWRAKYLLVLGILIAAAGGSLDAGASGWVFNLRTLRRLVGMVQGLAGSGGGTAAPPVALPGGPQIATLLVTGAVTIAVIALLALFTAIAGAVIARIAAGTLIAGVGGGLAFRDAVRKGLHYTWRLIIIISIPPIPVIASLTVSVLVLGVTLYAAGLAGNPAGIMDFLGQRQGLMIGLGLFNLPFALVTACLLIVQIAADRACVLGDARPIEAFRRGWRAIRAHLPLFAGLLAIQLAAGAVLGVLFHLPDLVVPFVGGLVIQPVQWIVTGVALACFSALWTQTWQDWAEEVQSADGANASSA